jgi:hypothetical protein
MASYKGPLDYIDVATRIVEFREKFPQGSLQPCEKPYVEKVEMPDGKIKSFMVYSAAAYRSPEDKLPGVGYAWEPIPGPTNFTRDSELQNAETAAWGRAMVAAFAVDTKKGIASSEEVRNRQVPDRPAAVEKKITPPARVYSDDEVILATVLVKSVAEQTDVEQLRTIWQSNPDLLDAPTQVGTLKDAINFATAYGEFVTITDGTTEFVGKFGVDEVKDPLYNGWISRKKK